MTEPRHSVDRLAFDEDVVARAIAKLVPSGETGRSFQCVLPGHAGEAVVERRDGDGMFVYRDCTGLRETLAAVRATIAYAPVGLVPVSGVSAPKRWESLYWYRRLFMEGGDLEPVEVPMPDVPERAREAVRVLAREFRTLVGLRWITHPGEPTLFGRKLAAGCSGLSEDVARLAISDLMRLGVVSRVGAYGNAYIYLPGAP